MSLPPAPETLELKLKYSQGLMRLMWGRYGNGRIALELHDDETGEPISRATVNFPEIDLKDGETVIKDWSENEGMLAALEGAGIVKPTPKGITLPHGGTAPICRWAVQIPEV
jgi:hypothetical protein